MTQFQQNFKKYSKKIGFVILTILFINIIQWASIQFLYNYCSKSGFWGVVENLLSLGSPVCHFVNNIQYNLSTYYVQMWITSGISILSMITF
jgi:hypothetical protein